MNARLYVSGARRPGSAEQLGAAQGAQRYGRQARRGSARRTPVTQAHGAWLSQSHAARASQHRTRHDRRSNRTQHDHRGNVAGPHAARLSEPHAARPAQHHMWHDRRGTARGTAVAQLHATQPLWNGRRTARRTTVEATRGTPVAAPRARHGRRSTARSMPVAQLHAARPSQDRTRHDHRNRTRHDRRSRMRHGAPWTPRRSRRAARSSHSLTLLGAPWTSRATQVEPRNLCSLKLLGAPWKPRAAS